MNMTILKNNENKNNRDHSHPDEQDDIPLNILIQEPTNQSDVTTEISQDPGVNNEPETVPIYRWRKKVIEYFDVSFKEPTLSPDHHDTLSPYEYFRLFVTTEMLQTIAFETNRYSLQRFGEDMRIPGTAEELEKCIGCYFWMGFVKMSNQRTFWETDLSSTGVLSVLSRNWLERLTRTIHMVDNLSVDAKTKEDNKLWKIRSWLENLRQNFLKVSPDKFNSVDEIMVLFKGKSYLRQYLPNKRHKWGFKISGRSGVSGFLYDLACTEDVLIKVILLWCKWQCCGKSILHFAKTRKS